jgi:hypothetical protein
MESDSGLTVEQAAQEMERVKAAIKRMEIHFIAPREWPNARPESGPNAARGREGQIQETHHAGPAREFEG